MLNLITEAGKLKNVKRKGWIDCGINDPESVAEHSFRTAVMAMILAPPGLDKEKLVMMALVHDLPEAEVGDITPYDGVSKEDKKQRELEAAKNYPDDIRRLVVESIMGESKEARFLKELDALEMAIQAKEYSENNTVNERWTFMESAAKAVHSSQLKKILGEING